MSVTINGRKATMEEEKQLAIEMWEFVRVCQIDLGTGCSSDILKRKFCNMKLKCGISINWVADCFLCNYARACLDCPLYKTGGGRNCCEDAKSPYHVTVHPNKYLRYQVDAAIDKIIEAIREL